MITFVRNDDPRTTFSSLGDILSSVEGVAVLPHVNDVNPFAVFKDEWVCEDFLKAYNKVSPLKGKEPIGRTTIEFWSFIYAVEDYLQDKGLFVLLRGINIADRRFFLKPYQETFESCGELVPLKNTVRLNKHFIEALDSWCDSHHENIYTLALYDNRFVIEKGPSVKIAYFHALKENHPLLHLLSTYLNIPTGAFNEVSS